MNPFETLIIKKPYTAGIRHQVFSKNNLFSNVKIGKLQKTLKSTSGRNNSGAIVFRRKNYRYARAYRFLDKNRASNYNVPSIVKTLYLDAFRSSFIALVYSTNGTYSFILAVKGFNPSSKFYAYTGRPLTYTVGNSSQLRYITEGSMISNVEKYPFFGGIYLKAAGAFSIFLNRSYQKKEAMFRLPSGRLQTVSFYCNATIGRISNSNYLHKKIGSASRARFLGKRFVVRGVAKNPVDHPHGGGEGKKSKAVTAHSPWGMVCKFKKTARIKYSI